MNGSILYKQLNLQRFLPVEILFVAQFDEQRTPLFLKKVLVFLIEVVYPIPGDPFTVVMVDIFLAPLPSSGLLFEAVPVQDLLYLSFSNGMGKKTPEIHDLLEFVLGLTGDDFIFGLINPVITPVMPIRHFLELLFTEFDAEPDALILADLLQALALFLQPSGGGMGIFVGEVSADYDIPWVPDDMQAQVVIEAFPVFPTGVDINHNV